MVYTLKTQSTQQTLSRQMTDGMQVAIIQIIITPHTPTTTAALMTPIIQRKTKHCGYRCMSSNKQKNNNK